MQHLVLYRTIWDHLDFGTTLDHNGQHHLRSYGTMSIVHCRATFESSLVVIGLLCWHIFCYKWQLWYGNLMRGSWTCVPESTGGIVYISNIQLYNVWGVVWISFVNIVTWIPTMCSNRAALEKRCKQMEMWRKMSQHLSRLIALPHFRRSQTWLHLRDKWLR